MTRTFKIGIIEVLVFVFMFVIIVKCFDIIGQLDTENRRLNQVVNDQKDIIAGMSNEVFEIPEGWESK